MKRIEIHISYSCNNNCVFCSEKDSLDFFSGNKVDLSELKKVLIEKRKQGFDHVNFTGGEPTLYDNFAELLDLTKKLGYRIYLGSNGSFWADQQNCDKFLPYLDEVSLSLHGSNELIHQKHTCQSDSFSLISKSFSNINKYIADNKTKHYFLCNTVITKNNLDDISNILKFIGGFNNLKQILISNLAPEGAGLKNYTDLAVSFTELKKIIPVWVKLAEQAGVIIRFFGLPLCVLGDHYVNSNDLSWDDRITYELEKENNRVFLKAKETLLDRNRQKIAVCADCTMSELCGGIFSKYVKLFGENEIIPLNYK